MHSIIAGQTRSGKSTLAKTLSGILARRGEAVYVLDPKNSRWPGATWQTDDAENFMDVVKCCRDGFLFCDEASNYLYSRSSPLNWLAVGSAGYGFKAFFIVQRINQLSTVIRDQCDYLYLFLSAIGSCEVAAAEWGKKELLQAATIQRGSYLRAQKSTPAAPVLHNLFNPKGY